MTLLQLYKKEKKYILYQIRKEKDIARKTAIRNKRIQQELFY